MGGRRRRRRRPPRAAAGTPPAAAAERKPRSRWWPGYWGRHPALAALLAGGGAVVLFHLAAGVLVDRTHLRERGLTTRAVVEGISETRRRPVMKVRFSMPEGRSVHGTTVEIPRPRPSRGDLVTVVYDPARPEAVYLPGGGPPLFPAAYLSTFGLLLVGPYGWHLRRTWSHRCGRAEDWRYHRPVRSLEDRRSHRSGRELP